MTNVLFLVVDFLRYDVVADDEFDTLTLDALAEEGVSFSQCFAQGISTAPSMTAMLTGRYPLDYGGH
jgi:arylsulfatase A-like enzyme